MSPTVAARPAFLNWPLVAGASAFTLLVLTGLGLAAWTILQSPDKKDAKVAAKAPRTKLPNNAIQPAAPPAPSAPVEDPAGVSAEEAQPQVAIVAAPSVPTAPAALPAAPETFLETPREEAVCQSYGTSVKFLANPADAARQAARDQKLQFVLHISGNFEDSKFT
jgi:hypothetical protein